MNHPWDCFGSGVSVERLDRISAALSLDLDQCTFALNQGTNGEVGFANRMRANVSGSLFSENINGSGLSLNGLATRHADDLDGYLRESILEPGKVVTEGFEAAMPSFAGVIPAQELEDLVAYLKQLR